MDLLWTSFLNSDWHDWRGSGRSEDRLEKDEWLVEFLAEWHLEAPVPPALNERAALQAFRAFLRRLAEGLNAGGAPSPADLAELNGLMLAGPVVRQVTAIDAGHRLELRPVGQGWPQAMAQIAADFARTLAEGEAARIRICENPDCLWVFYDDTRNRTKRFCDEKACGNLLKVRRFRARQKGV